MGFLSAQAAGERGILAPQVLVLAAGNSGSSFGAMPRHFHEFGEAGNHSSGVFLIPQRVEVRVAIEELLLIWLVSEASDWNDQLVWLPL